MTPVGQPVLLPVPSVLARFVLVFLLPCFSPYQDQWKEDPTGHMLAAAGYYPAWQYTLTHDLS